MLRLNKLIYLQCIVLSIYWGQCDSARILVVMPTPSYSHQIVYFPLWRRLLENGHHVTLFATDPLGDKNLTNFRHIDWSFAYDMWHVKHNISNLIINFKNDMVNTYFKFIDMIFDIEREELNHPLVLEILQNKSEHFDLVIVEFLTPLMFAFSNRFNCPYIGVSPMDMSTYAYELLGSPYSPAVFSDPVLGYFDSYMSFTERLLNTCHYILVKFFFDFYFMPREEVAVKKYFGIQDMSLKDTIKNVSMIFLNTNPVINDIRPVLPNIIQIGGGTHLNTKGKKLSKDLQLFLEKAPNGVIYFSLGTNVKQSDLSLESITAIKNVFDECPYKIIWKIDGTTQIKNTTNIFVHTWLPQQEILAHPNVMLFITQGGLQSLEEAIYNEVPIIGIPFFTDQFKNIKNLVRKGSGVELDFRYITKHTFKNAIEEVVGNKKYKESMQKLAAILKDRQLSGIDEAIWWVEYVLRNKGGGKLKSSEFDLPFYQLLLLDVAAIFLITSVLLIFSLYKISKYFINLFTLKKHIKVE